MRRFGEKVVIVTGAASGIGAATARRFHSEGASVVLADLDEAGLASQFGALEDGTGRLLSRRTDVSASADATSLIEATVDRFSRLDILINNAGVSSFGQVATISDAEWRRVMSIDLDSVFYVSRAAIPHLVETRGCIVNTASIAGLFGDGGVAAYSSAKAGVINLTRSMARDYADRLRVNAVCPGMISTGMSKGVEADATLMKEWLDQIPMGHIGIPDNVAGAIAFLASDDASYITGTTLVVDGGLASGTGGPNLIAFTG